MWGRTRPLASRSISSASSRRCASGSWVAKLEELEAAHLDALEQDEVERDAGDRARRVADGHEPAAVAQRTQRRLGDVAAHRVDHDVGTVGERRLQRGPEVAAAGHQRGGAAVGGDGQLLLGGRHRRDRGAERGGDLDGRQADPAARAQHDDLLAGGQRGRSSAARAWRSGAPPRRRPPRPASSPAGAGVTAAAPTTASSAKAPTKPVPETRSPTVTVVDVVGHLGDDARHLAADDERGRDLDLVLAGDQQDVGEVRPRRRRPGRGPGRARGRATGRR